MLHIYAKVKNYCLSGVPTLSLRPPDAIFMVSTIVPIPNKPPVHKYSKPLIYLPT